MDDTHNQQRVIKADRHLRMLAIIAWIVCVLAGLAFLIWALPWGQGRLEQAEPDTALRVVQTVIGFTFLSVVPLGVYLAWFGRRVIAHRQIPPPGTKVIVDTKVFDGETAAMRGRLMIGMGLALIAMGLVGGLYLPYKFGKAFGERIHSQSRIDGGTK